ncbi:HAD family hydrolase [Amycolatopsis thermoflava]|uniref:HAD family hydrolase n=1 Tax=Amycolatopsis thermoflava TaxID=84480 RepID=UPI0003F740EB|nr:HAD family hydrolase [Amycolatopsis thermoflava]
MNASLAITVDVGGVIGTYTGPSTAEVLATIADAPANAAEVDRDFFSVAPTVTDELRELACRRLLIPPDAWPADWTGTWTAGFTPYHGAIDAMARLAMLGPVAALPNLSVLGGRERMTQLEQHCGQHLTAICPSFELRARKPEHLCWTRTADRLGATVADLVHIGDRIPEDILGALNAGCRAAILANTRDVTVPDHLRAHPRVFVVPDLPAAADLLTELVLTESIPQSDTDGPVLKT